jgi:hypothetical protein
MRLPHLGVLLTTFCNLNCRDCANLIPKRDNYIYEIGAVKEDLEKVLESIEGIDEVLLIGGETLLYPYLGEAIEFCFNQSKIDKIIITSNGTIEPSEKLMGIIADCGVIMRVSGYPEFVAPRREEIVQKYLDRKIAVDNLKGMSWFSMGGTEKRNHTKQDLISIFSTCGMRNCVTMQRDGLVFFCSRQMTAWDSDIYPVPLKHEYVDVRNSKDLPRDFEAFYSNQFVSTCDYCDGISCATERKVETAIQILPKDVYIKLFQMYVTESEYDEKDFVKEVTQLLIPYGDCLKGVDEYVSLLFKAKEILKGEEGNCSIRGALLELINKLSDDYSYEVDETVCCKKTFEHEVSAQKKPNVIRVSGDVSEQKADIIIDKEDVKEYSERRFPLDLFSYSRLFVQSKLERISNNPVNAVLCGLSYTQYGFLENRFADSVVNLSITGQDMPYQILMARRALAVCEQIKTVIMPMTYYQGFYDMVADDAEIHQMAVSRVNIPLLSYGRGYNGPRYYEYFPAEYLKLFDYCCDTDRVRKLCEDEIKEYLRDKEFFNDYMVASPRGGLKFDFKELDEKERYESAKKTAELNERIVTESGFDTVMAYVKEFLEDMRFAGKRVILFAPPMTKYLYDAYSRKMIDRFNDNYVKLFDDYYNVTYVDLSNDKSFTENDFCDFEHLNANGAIKLTDILNSIYLNSAK